MFLFTCTCTGGNTPTRTVVARTTYDVAPLTINLQTLTSTYMVWVRFFCSVNSIVWCDSWRSTRIRFLPTKPFDVDAGSGWLPEKGPNKPLSCCQSWICVFFFPQNLCSTLYANVYCLSLILKSMVRRSVVWHSKSSRPPVFNLGEYQCWLLHEFVRCHACLASVAASARHRTELASQTHTCYWWQVSSQDPATAGQTYSSQ